MPGTNPYQYLNAVVNRIILFTGSFTNSNKFTLGNGGVIQAQSLSATREQHPPQREPSMWRLPLTLYGGPNFDLQQNTTSRTTGPEVNPTRSITTSHMMTMT